MPTSLGNPWILEYIRTVSESSDCSNPSGYQCPRKQKVQITRFRTYKNHENDDCVWADISDQQSSIPTKFTKAALTSYEAISRSRRFTQNKDWLIVIDQYRLSVGRIPTGSTIPNTSKMTEKAHLYLEVNEIYKVIGTQGPTNAKWVESDARVHDWVEGLRLGQGSMIRNRKRASETGPPESSRQAAERQASLPSLRVRTSNPSYESPCPMINGPVTRSISGAVVSNRENSTTPSNTSPGNSRASSVPRFDLKAYKLRWKPKADTRYMLVKSVATRALLDAIPDDDPDYMEYPDLHVHEASAELAQPAALVPASQRQTTPEAWEATQVGSSDGPASEELDEPEHGESDQDVCRSPSAKQAAGIPSPTSAPPTPPSSSPPRSVPATQFSQPTPSFVAETPNLFRKPSRHGRADMPRSPLVTASGGLRHGNALVENSDVSMSQSQSQSQPHSKPSASSEPSPNVSLAWVQSLTNAHVGKTDKRPHSNILLSPSTSSPPRVDRKEIKQMQAHRSVPADDPANWSDTEEDSPVISRKLVKPILDALDTETVTGRILEHEPSEALRHTSGSSTSSHKSESGRSLTSGYRDIPSRSPTVPSQSDVFSDSTTLERDRSLRTRSLPGPRLSTPTGGFLPKSVVDASEEVVKRKPRVGNPRISITRAAFLGRQETTSSETVLDRAPQDHPGRMSQSLPLLLQGPDYDQSGLVDQPLAAHQIDVLSSSRIGSESTVIGTNIRSENFVADSYRPDAHPRSSASLRAEDLPALDDQASAEHNSLPPCQGLSKTLSVTSVTSTSTTRSQSRSRGSLIIKKPNGEILEVQDGLIRSEILGSRPAFRTVLKRPRSSEAPSASASHTPLGSPSSRPPARKKPRREALEPPEPAAGLSAQPPPDNPPPDAAPRRKRLRGWKPDLRLPFVPEHAPGRARIITWERSTDSALQALRWRHQLAKATP